MPITKSAQKAISQNRRQRVFNLRRIKTMKEIIKEIKGLVKENKKDEATKLLSKTYQVIDKATKRGVIKKNAASRKKSRLAKSIAKIPAA